MDSDDERWIFVGANRANRIAVIYDRSKELDCFKDPVDLHAGNREE